MSLERQFGIAEPIPLVQTAQVRSTVNSLTAQESISRIRVLERTAMELIEKSLFDQKRLFQDWDNFTRTVRSAISGNFLDSVSIYGRRKKELIFLLDITIDWQRHRIFANEATFAPLDPSKSIAEQVDGAIRQIILFIQRKVVALNIDEISPYISLTPGNEDEQKRKRKITGTSPATGRNLADLREFDARAIGLEVKPARLSEMTITVKFTK